MSTLRGPKSKCQELHPDTPRGPCAICKESKHPPRYWHYKQAQKGQHDVLVSNLRSRGIGELDCICRTCQHRYSSLPSSTDEGSSTPKVQKQSHPQHCCVPNCICDEDTAIHTLDINQRDVVQPALHISTFQCQFDQHTFQLCHRHYCQYHSFDKTISCIICSKMSSKRYPKSNFRSVNDNVDIACKYVKLFWGREEASITSEDMYCNVCRMIVQRFSSSPQCKSARVSEVQYLKVFFDIFRAVECHDVQSCLQFSFSQSMIFLEGYLLHDNPILLQTVAEFRSVVKDTKSNTKNISKSISIHSDYQSVHFW